MDRSALQMLEMLPDGIMIVDPDVRVSWSSSAAANLFGRPADDLIGTPVVDFLHPDDRAMAVIGFSVIEPGTTTPEVALRIRREDGSWIVVGVRAANRTDDPDVRGLVVVLREQAPTAALAAVSSDRLRTMLDASSDLTLLLDGAGDIRWASAAATRLLGHLPMELIGTSWAGLLDPTDGSGLDRVLESRPTDDSGRSVVDARLLDREGEWRQFEVHVTNRLEDPTIDGVILSARDITRLRDTENLLWQAIEKAQLGVLEIDEAGVIVNANDALTKLVSEPASAITGRMIGHSLDPDERSRFERELGLLRSGLIEVVHTELCWNSETDHAGDGRWLALRVSRVSSDASALPRLMAFATDITDEKHRATRSDAEHQALVRQSTQDPLTDVLNRRGLMQNLRPAVEEGRARGHTQALLFVDLDAFKAVNDDMGHQAGDAVLVTVARRLQEGVRGGDLVGRYGGDEFVVLARVRDLDQAEALALRLERRIAAPIMLGTELHSISASIGVAMTADANSIDQLLRDADRSMYARKRNRQSARASMAESDAGPA